MKYFEHTRAGSYEEASGVLKSNPDAAVIAGGTDLLGTMKNEIMPENPKMIVDLKQIDGAAGITVGGGSMRIGALTTLTTIAESAEVKEKVPMLSQAAKSVATPLLRNTGTIGGNICQDVSCWFYRYPHEAGGRMVCSRKDGETCYAIQGDNRYHSVFGGMKAHSMPCSTGCPAGTDIPAYMEQIRLGNVAGAAQIIMRANPMAVMTSRVCAHFCQDHCNRASMDESVAIRNVERFVGDYTLENKEKYFKAPSVTTGKKVAVVGSGPSGLSAAYYLRAAGNEVTVYDSKEEPGGMLMYAIPAYRLPKDIVRRYTGALAEMGIKFVLNTKIGKDIAPEELEKKFDSIYYATVAWKRPVLGLAGEELTIFGLDFLVEVHKWMEGKVGEEVLVTGGGNVAMDVAITAKRLGAKKVILACLESESEMPASKDEIARAREEGIEIMPSWGLSKVISSNGIVKGMELKRCVSVFDEKRRFSPQYDESQKIIINAENILMAVGQKADLSFLDDKYQMQLNARGLTDVSEDTQMTSRPGVFAGGDATTGPATVIQGIRNGHNSARGINRYLGLPREHECKGMVIEKPFLSFDAEGVKNKKAAKLEEVPASERGIEIEDAIGLAAEKAIEESKRCMNCGCYAVNPSDVINALVALDATIKTTEREMKASEFACDKLRVKDVLNPGELVKEIVIPLVEGAVMHYDKFRLRESVDFAIVGLATMFGMEKGKISGSRIVIGGVAPIPVRMNELEGFLMGKEINEQTADAAADLAVKYALPMAKNEYKLPLIKTMIKRALLRLA